MDIRLLGPPEFCGADPRHLGGRRQQSALAALALSLNEWLPRDHLIGLMWAEPPASAVSTVQGYLSHLRLALRTADASLESSRHGYRLVASADSTDVNRFEAALAEAAESIRCDGPGTAEAALRRALGLWRGSALLGFEEAPFAGPAAARLEELRLSAAVDLARICLRTGRHGTVLPDLEQLVRLYPAHEVLWEMLMSTLCAAGRQGDALAAYQRARHHLADELGIEPGERLRAVQRRILRSGPSRHCAAVEDPAWSYRKETSRSFVGRVEELASVERLVAEHGLVTLVGPAGAGKTRLAQQVARRVATQRRRRARQVVDLSSTADLLGAFRAVCGALEVSATELDLSLLQQSDTGEILVLDGCEHLLEEAATLVAQLIAHAADARVIVTSRQPLGIAGETVFHVRPMRLPTIGASVEDVRYADSVALFVERAGAARLSMSELLAAADLCRQLDGLPLAIELAAGLARTIPIADLAGRLAQRLSLLVADDAAAPARQPRHRSLSAALDWSYQLLSDEDSTLFTALGVFAGRFDMPAVEALAAIGGSGATTDGISGLTRLVQRSLVDVVPDSGVRRYRLLDSARTYTESRLTPAEGARLRQRHAHHHVALIRSLASQLDRADAPSAIAEFTEAEPDVIAALGYLTTTGDTDAAAVGGLALVRCLVRLYRMPEARHRIAELSEAPVAGPLRCRVLRWAALLSFFDDDFAECRRLLDIGLRLTEGSDFATDRALLRCQEAELVRHDGDYDGALSLLDEADSLAPGIPPVRIASLRMRSALMWDRGCFADARRCAEEWLVLALRAGNLRAEAEARTQLAGVLRELGQLESSAAEYERAMNIFTVLQDPLELAHQQYASARLALFRGDPTTAAELAGRSEAAFARLGDAWGTAVARKAGGEAALALGDIDRARAQLKLAHDGLAVRGFKDDVAAVCLQLALAERIAGNPAEATWRCEEGLRATLELPTSRFREPLQQLLGELAAESHAAESHAAG